MPRSDGYARMSAVARSNGLRSREMCADHSVCVLLFSESAAVMVNALRRVQSDLTELNWYDLVFDELTKPKGKQGEPIGHWLTHTWA